MALLIYNKFRTLLLRPLTLSLAMINFYYSNI